MAKSNIKVLLVALTTFREINGEKKRVRFAAGKPADLTAAELESLDKLTVATGKLHYRDPVHEGVVAAEPEAVAEGDTFDGESVAMGDKTVAQLKAYLDANGVEYADDAKKADLLAAAEAHEADPDGGL